MDRAGARAPEEPGDLGERPSLVGDVIDQEPWSGGRILHHGEGAVHVLLLVVAVLQRTLRGPVGIRSTRSR